MTSHLCRDTGEWAEGTLVSCGCAVPNRGPLGYLPEGYKDSTKTWRVDGPPESNNTQTEHWSGQLDAKVRPKPVSMKVSMSDG